MLSSVQHICFQRVALTPLPSFWLAESFTLAQSAQSHRQVSVSHFDTEDEIPGLWTQGQMEPLAECWGWGPFPEEVAGATDAPSMPFPPRSVRTAFPGAGAAAPCP